MNSLRNSLVIHYWFLTILPDGDLIKLQHLRAIFTVFRQVLMFTAIVFLAEILHSRLSEKCRKIAKKFRPKRVPDGWIPFISLRTKLENARRRWYDNVVWSKIPFELKKINSFFDLYGNLINPHISFNMIRANLQYHQTSTTNNLAIEIIFGLSVRRLTENTSKFIKTIFLD